MAQPQAERSAGVNTVEYSALGFKRLVKTFKAVIQNVGDLEVDHRIFVFSDFFVDAEVQALKRLKEYIRIEADPHDLKRLSLYVVKKAGFPPCVKVAIAEAGIDDIRRLARHLARILNGFSRFFEIFPGVELG